MQTPPSNDTIDVFYINICCVVFFGKWKQIIIAGEEFNIVTFFGFKRSRFLAIPVLAPNTELHYDSNNFWTAGINVVRCGRICWIGMNFIRVPQCQYLCKKRRERRSRYQRDWIPYTELGKTAPDIITPCPRAFRLGFPLPQIWIVNLYHKRNTSHGRLYINITFSITCPDRLWSPPILLFNRYQGLLSQSKAIRSWS